MRRARLLAATTIAAVVVLLALARGVDAQSLQRARLGLAELPQSRAASTGGAMIGDGRTAHGHWQTGALIGGLIGAALAVTYNSVVYDSEHKSLRVLEFTFGSAIIGGLITAK